MPMDPQKPMIYLLPTRLTLDELRQWGDRVSSFARVTQVAGEADFIVGKSTCPPSRPSSSRFFPTDEINHLPYKPLGGCAFQFEAQDLVEIVLEIYN